MDDPTPPTQPALPDGAEEPDRFFNLSLDMLCIAGFDGYFKRLNAAWEKTLGWPSTELLATPYLDYVHPDDRAGTVAEAQKLTAGVLTVSFENRYLCRDGSYKWLEWTAAPARQDGLIYAVARDRTEHRNAEEEIKRTQLFLDSIVENIPNLIFVKDAKDLRLILFNRAGEELLGSSRADLIGKNDNVLFPGEQAGTLIARDREVLAGKNLVDSPEEPVQTRVKGLRYLHIKRLPLLDERGEPQYLLGIAEDVTEQKRLDAAKSEFIALASHQLRSPLTGIRWALELLQEEPAPLTERQRKLVSDGHDAAVRMAETIQTMLRASRLEAQTVGLNPSTVPLHPLLRQIQGDYAPACASKRQTFSVCCPEDISLQTDPQLLGEILRNLVSNAIKYTPPEGTIRVDVGTEAGRGVRISVSDTGIGIPAGEQASVFAKLFRVSNAVALDPGGTGLGLYVASSLANLLGSALSFVSEERRGTTFTLILPPSLPPHEQDRPDR